MEIKKEAVAIFWLIFSVIFSIGGFVGICAWNYCKMKEKADEVEIHNRRYAEKREEVQKPKLFTWKAFSSLVFLLLVIPGCVASVPTGYTGIMTEFGKVLDGTLDAGIHFKTPWRSVVTMDNRTQKISGTTAAFSSDIQQVDIDYSINYSIDKSTAMTLYRNVGAKYYDTIVAPRLAETMKSAFSKYTADSLITNRDKLSSEIAAGLTLEMQGYGINIISVNVENIDFTDAFTNAVEAKQVAQQEKLRAETVQEQAVMEAEAKARQDVISAQAAADVQKLQSDAALYAAQNEAKANVDLAQSITDGLIQYMQMEKWDGKVPTVQMDGIGNVYPVIDLP